MSGFVVFMAKRFCDDGPGYVAIESGSIAVGSIRGELDGKANEREIPFHKLMYETCLRIIPKGFFEWSTKVILAEFGVIIC